MKAKLADMAPVVDLTRGKGTGPVRFQRPIYTDLLPPCNNACPAGENIQALARVGPGGQIPRGLGDIGAGQSAAGCAWPCLLPPLRRRL